MADLPRLRRRLLVSLGERRGKTADGIEIVPVTTLLEWLASGTLLP